MASPHKATVVFKNGQHVCDPTEIRVNGGDKIVWGGPGLPVVFPESPFEGDVQTIEPASASTVKRGLEKGKKFKMEKRLGDRVLPVEGQVIVIEP